MKKKIIIFSTLCVVAVSAFLFHYPFRTDCSGLILANVEALTYGESLSEQEGATYIDGVGSVYTPHEELTTVRYWNGGHGCVYVRAYNWHGSANCQ